MIARLCIGGLVLGLLVGPAFGQTAGMLSFQALLKDGAGNPIAGPVDLEFRIYDAQAGGSLVDMDGDGVIEDPGDDAIQVPGALVTDGVVSTKFGPVAPSAFNGSRRWLEVTVDGAALSRTEIATAPATAEQLNIPGTGTPAVTVTGDGDVGIGATIPEARLHIQGQSEDFVSEVLVSNSSILAGSRAGLRATAESLSEEAVTSTGRVGAVADFVDDEAIRKLILSAEVADMSITFETLGVERMRIAPDGSVGIGTLDPQSALEVQDSQSIVRITSTDSPNGSVLELRNDTLSAATLGAINFLDSSGNTPGTIAYRGTDDALTFNTNLAERVRITAEGTVGIGTADPQSTLDVNGTGSATDVLVRSSRATLLQPVPVSELRLKATDASLWTFTGSASMSASVRAFLDPGGGGIRADGRLKLATEEPWMPITFETTGVERMRITPEGSVGIGTNAPVDAQLSVKTSIHLDAVKAQSGNPSGLEPANLTAVWADTQASFGVVGSSATGIGVVGLTGTGFAIVGEVFLGGAGKAGRFVGDVDVIGTLSKSGGSFRIDHPLDPANKYLSHSFVESPDMMNIYNGNVVTDEEGYAVVELPDYFEALNRDFRYQLTVIDQFAQAIVAAEIKDNRFSIRTDKPNVKVSWQVTGIRKDPWAQEHRIVVEQEKDEGDRGRFLHPELYGQPRELRVGPAFPIVARRTGQPDEEVRRATPQRADRQTPGVASAAQGDQATRTLVHKHQLGGQRP